MGIQVDPKEIFDVAVEFEYSSDLLMKYFGENNMEALHPLTVNNAFTLELYIKSLLVITKGGLPKKHNLKILYNLLFDEDQIRINEFFTSNIHVKRRKEKKHIDYTGMTFEIEQILEKCSNAFIEFRYPFEYNPGFVYGISDLSRSVKTCILQHKPDWDGKFIEIAGIYK